MDKLLHDLVETYTEMTPELHAKTRHMQHTKICRGASRRGQFWGGEGVALFACNFGIIWCNFQPNRTIICPPAVLLFQGDEGLRLKLLELLKIWPAAQVTEELYYPIFRFVSPRNLPLLYGALYFGALLWSVLPSFYIFWSI